MKIYKMHRDVPEVVGGKTTADIPETALEEALSNGWKISEEKGSSVKENEIKTDTTSGSAGSDEDNVRIEGERNLNNGGNGTTEAVNAAVRNSRSRNRG